MYYNVIGKLCCYIAAKESPESDSLTIARVIVNKLCDHHYTGTGDVTCALLLSWTDRLKGIQDGSFIYGTALLNAVSSIQAVLAKAQSNASNSTSSITCKSVELPIIQCKLDLENPPLNKLLELNNCRDICELYHLWKVKI